MRNSLTNFNSVVDYLSHKVKGDWNKPLDVKDEILLCNNPSYINALASVLLSEDQFIKNLRSEVDRNLIQGIEHVSDEFLITQAEGFFKSQDSFNLYVIQDHFI